MDYENKAELDLDTNGMTDDPFADLTQPTADETDEAETTSDNSMSLAFAEPIVIE